MKALKNILIGFIGLIALLFIISIFLPSTYKVERSLAINKPADSIFVIVNSLKNWPKWDPWYKEDPSVVRTYLGPESGIGNTQTWTDKSGKGTLTITESIQPKLVAYQLQFEGFDPMQGRFEIIAETDSITNVRWISEGDMGNNPIKKYFGVFMDRMMGDDFQKGLTNMNN